MELKIVIPDKPNAEVYKSLEEIPGNIFCKKHNFGEATPVGNSPSIKFLKNLIIPIKYNCKKNGCRQSAYYCPNCEGYIEGSTDDKNYNNIIPLAGSAGQDHYCVKCGDYLGRSVWMYSVSPSVAQIDNMPFQS